MQTQELLIDQGDRELTRKLLDKGLLIKQEDIKHGWIVVVKAPNRQFLVDYLREIITNVPEDGVFLHVGIQDEETGCNNSIDYKTEQDIPDHSVPCPCGNSNHWMIKYEQN